MRSVYFWIMDADTMAETLLVSKLSMSFTKGTA